MITFKNIEDKDQAFIEKLCYTVREKELSATNWPEDQKQRFVIMHLMAQLTHYETQYKGATYQVIFYKKKAAGRLYLWEVNETVHILDISLLPQFQGKGIGRNILTGIIKQAKQANKIATLHVDHNNIPAKKLYESLGFKKVSSTKTHEYMECRSE